jgi:predicted kinase
MLIIFCGLPGTGKTTLARMLARKLQATYLRIDTIEEVLLAHDGVSADIGPEGYCVAYGVAEDNLALGGTVVADSVNPSRITREAWRDVARRVGVRFVDVAVSCHDHQKHRRRIDARPTGTRGSDWAKIQIREFDAPAEVTIAVDTSVQTIEQSFSDLMIALRGLQ